MADRTQGPTYLLKIDLLDGFYHVHLRAQDAPLLGVPSLWPPVNCSSWLSPWFCLWGGQKVPHISAPPWKP